MCTKQSTGLSLQLVSCCEEPAAVTLAPLCASCVVAFGVAEPKRGAPKRKVEKRYSVWKRLAKVEFRGRKDRKEKVKTPSQRGRQSRPSDPGGVSSTRETDARAV